MKTKRVLVTVSGGVAHVDCVPEDVTVEVRDFDMYDNETPSAWEVGPDLRESAVELIQDGDDWRRKDGARPEFDGEAR